MTDDSNREAFAVGEELLADAAEIAAAYREDGWEGRVPRPTAVSPIATEDRVGFDVVVSDADYDLVETAVEREGAVFDAAEVFRRSTDGAVSVLAIECDATTGTAIVVPLSYDADDAAEVLETARTTGALRVFVRPESGGPGVAFSHDDPSLFVVDDANPS